jgi:hypothetical protein
MNNTAARMDPEQERRRLQQRISEIEGVSERKARRDGEQSIVDQNAEGQDSRPPYTFDSRYDDPRMKPTGKIPPRDSESEQINHWPELESILKGNEEITRALVDEIFRLRQMLANERLDRRMEQEQAMKLLGMISEHARTPFVPTEMKNPNPPRW